MEIYIVVKGGKLSPELQFSMFSIIFIQIIFILYIAYEYKFTKTIK